MEHIVTIVEARMEWPKPARWQWRCTCGSCLLLGFITYPAACYLGEAHQARANRTTA